MKIAVSYLNVEKKNISKVVSELDKTTVDFIHMDVMDGKYVPKKANLFSDVEDIGYYTRKRLDIHFMVQKPLKIIDDYASLNVFCMTFHLNIKDDIEKVIERCHKFGIKVGLAINPEDEIDIIDPYLEKIDLILVMSVHPGLPGQEFIKTTLPKIKALKSKIKKTKRDILLSVDGGINLNNKDFLGDADILAVGSAITNSNDYEKTIEELRS